MQSWFVEFESEAFGDRVKSRSLGLQSAWQHRHSLETYKIRINE